MSRKKNRREPTGPGELIAAAAFTLGMIALTNIDNTLQLGLACGGAGFLFTLAVLLIIQTQKQRQARRLASMQLQQLSPIEFERAVAELFRHKGYEANVTPPSNDRGIDILLKKEGNRFAVQCKRYQEAIGPAYIREFVGALEGAGLTHGYFVTTSRFSSGAKQAAQNSRYQVELVNGAMLGQWHQEAKKAYRTDLVNAAWWRVMAPKQKAVLVALLALVVGVISGGLAITLSQVV